MTYNLEHLEQLEQAATSGTWELTHPLQNVEPAEYIDEFYSEAWQVWPPSRPLIKPLLKADAELIVAARNALPSLIAELRRERVRNAELQSSLDATSNDAVNIAVECRQLRTANAELVQQNELLRQPYESYTEDGEAVLPRGWVAVDGGRLDELEADSAETERLRTANAELVEALRPIADALNQFQNVGDSVHDYVDTADYRNAAEVLRKHGEKK